MNPTQPLVLLTGAQKVFTTDTVATLALDNVDLRIGEGEFVAITGPSGAGKSTLLLVIALLEELTAGEYRLGGHNVAGLAANQLAYLRNRFVGVVFQQSLLIPDLPVWENVALPLKYRGLAVKEQREQALEALGKVALSHRAWHRPSQLSGGNSSERLWPGPWWANPSLWWRMSQRATWTRSTAGKLWSCSEGLTKRVPPLFW